MLRNIKIRTKFTLIILTISLVAIIAISFFTYDYIVNANREKFANNLGAVADSRAAYFTSFFERAVAGIKLIQASDELAGQPGLPEEDGADLLSLFTQVSDTETPADSLMPVTGSSVEDYLRDQASIFGFDELYVTTASGVIVASTDENLNTGNFVAPDGSLLLRGKQEIYFGTVLREGNKFVTYAAAPVTSGDQGDVLIAKL